MPPTRAAKRHLRNWILSPRRPVHEANCEDGRNHGAGRLGLRARGVEDRLRDQPKGVVANPAAPHCWGELVPLGAQMSPFQFQNCSARLSMARTACRAVLQRHHAGSNDHGYAPLPEFTEPPVGPASRPDRVAQYPVVLTSAKPTLFRQTQHRALPSQRKRATYPAVEVHPAAAEARGVAAGDRYL